MLVVEDEPALLLLIRRILDRAGLRVLAAGSPAEALALVAEHGHAVDLLLTDVVMPQMSGRQLAERVTALVPRARVLYMSGYTDDDILQRGALEPGKAFIGKPFSRAALVAKIREVLSGRPAT